MKKNLLSSFMLFAAATLFVSCTDPAPEPTPPTPPEPPVPTEDVVLAPKFAIGSYNEDGKKEGYANFVVALSEVNGTYDLKFVAAGKALVLNLYAPISETMDLPVGKYNTSDIAQVVGPSVTNLTKGITIDAALKNTNTHSFKSMELEVARTGGTYTITFNGMTTGDTKYTCTYTAGKLDMTDITAEPEPDPDPVLTNVVTYEVSKPGEPAHYQLVMTDCTVDADGNPTSAGTKYIVDLYSDRPTDAINWRPAAGVYNSAEWASPRDPKTFSRESSTTISIVEQAGGTFDVDWGTAKNMMAGTVTITHKGDNGFTAVLNVELGDQFNPDVALTPLELTATDFKRVNNNPDPEPEPVISSIVEYLSAKGEVSNYSLIMTDCTVDANGKPTSAGTQYTVDLYSTLPTDVKNWRPAAGVYSHARSTGEMDEVYKTGTFLRDGSAAVSFTDQNGQIKPDWNTEKPMFSGTVTIAHVGENGFTAVLDVEVWSGTALEPVKFTADNFTRVNKGGAPVEPVEPDEPGEDPQTTFAEGTEKAVELDAATAAASYKKTEIEGLFCWTITIGSRRNNSFGFSMDIYSEALPEDGLPEGMFEAGKPGVAAVNTFEPGVYKAGVMTGAGYYEFKTTPRGYAAIVAGDIEIEKDQDTGEYTFYIGGTDVNGSMFMGEWKGEVDVLLPESVQQKNVRRR